MTNVKTGQASATKGIIEKAKSELASLTGFSSPAAIGIKKVGQNWVVAIEIVEKKSIPDGMDILGLYEVEINSSGDIAGYSRKGLRKRVDTQGPESTE